MSSSDTAVAFEHVSKRYLFGSGGGARGVLTGLLRAKRGADRARWALADLDLHVRQGESVGFIGHNGAGKTTALKLAAGITRATRGRVRTHGRVASLINLGAGFHRELSGRENVHLNGVLLGMSRGQVRERFDEIVAFSGIEPAMLDTPVKQYSTGMYARLGFAVAAHANADVLLVDEVLSVGDAAFQSRSLQRMLAFRSTGTAVLFVSHNLGAVEMMCQRVVWLDHGAVVQVGPAAEVVRAYLDAAGAQQEAQGDGAGWLAMEHVSVGGSDGNDAARLEINQPFTVRVQGRALRELVEPVFVISIRGDEGPLFAGNMHIDGNWPAKLDAGPFVVECAFGSARLAPGRYRVEVKVKQNVRTNYFEPRTLATFQVGAREAAGTGVVPHVWRVSTPADLPDVGGAALPVVGTRF